VLFCAPSGDIFAELVDDMICALYGGNTSGLGDIGGIFSPT
jgi:hypothetical protein